MFHPGMSDQILRSYHDDILRVAQAHVGVRHVRADSAAASRWRRTLSSLPLVGRARRAALSHPA